MKSKSSHVLIAANVVILFIGLCLSPGAVLAQNQAPPPTTTEPDQQKPDQGKVVEEKTEPPEPDYSFSFEAPALSKFMWRGQRLTDGWVLQPAGTVTAKGFSVNVFTNFELQAVNEGDTCYLKLNPDASSGGPNGLQGKFSEVDFTFSYAREYKGVSFEGGAIVYTLPYNRVSTPTTTELFGTLSFDSAPLSPGVGLYVDVDETRALGRTGMYLELSAGHSFELTGDRVKSIDLGGTFGVANAGFADYCYGLPEAGAHDASLSVSLPIALGKGWSTNLMLAYSALLGKYRDYQYVNLPDFYGGKAGDPRTYADTVWGGITFTFETGE